MSRTDQHSQANGIYSRYLKRIADIICAVLTLTVLSWLYVLLAILVRIKLGGPVIFRQERPGRIDPKTGRERIFTLYKFRTMTDERDERGKLLPDEVRLTRFGKLLRSTSLDELPEVFNILKGDMSVIGPRPLLVEYLPRYSAEQRHRHDVRPGLSGYAQINGRNTLSWDEKFELDVWYTRHISFLLDVKIVFLTIYKAFKREGINSQTSATMEKFVGSSNAE